MRLELVVLSNLFALGGSCAAQLGADHVLFNRHAHIDRMMKRGADDVVQRLAKRDQDVYGVPNGVWPTVVVPPGYTLAAGVQITPIPGFSSPTVSAALTAATGNANSTGLVNDLTGWNQTAEEACMTAVMNLKGKVSNPTGLAVCYNVPYLDAAKGIFEAELRLYNISAPSSPWLDVPSSSMTVSLSYLNATISKSDGSSIPGQKRDMILIEKRADQAVNAPSTSTVALAGQGSMPNGVMMPIEISLPRMYVGQLNSEVLPNDGSNLSSTSMQALLSPTIQINATNPDDKSIITATLSLKDASFVVGAFAASAAIITDPAQLLGNPSADIAAANAGLPTPFVVPGVTLGVTPVGLIVTCVWTALFLIAMGLGTLGRVHHRDQYRRAVKAQQEGRIHRF